MPRPLHSRWHEVGRQPRTTCRGQAWRRGRVLDYDKPSFSVAPSGQSVPMVGSAPDLTAAGYVPRWFVSNLLQGRWEFVRLYDESWDTYASAYGKYDGAFLWKLNFLIKSGYTPSIGAHGVQYYSPAPSLRDMGWLTNVSVPSRLVTLKIRVRAGGGLWCVDDGAADTQGRARREL